MSTMDQPSNMDKLSHALMRLQKILKEKNDAKVNPMIGTDGSQDGQEKPKTAALTLAAFRKWDHLGCLELAKADDSLPIAAPTASEDMKLDYDLVKKFFGPPKKKHLLKENQKIPTSKKPTPDNAASAFSSIKPISDERKSHPPVSGSNTAKLGHCVRPTVVTASTPKDKGKHAADHLKKKMKQSIGDVQKDAIGTESKIKASHERQANTSRDNLLALSIAKVASGHFEPKKRKADCLDESVLEISSTKSKPHPAKGKSAEKPKQQQPQAKSHISAIAPHSAKSAVSGVGKPPNVAAAKQSSLAKPPKVSAAKGNTVKPKLAEPIPASKKQSTPVPAKVPDKSGKSPFKIPTLPQTPTAGKRNISITNSAQRLKSTIDLAQKKYQTKHLGNFDHEETFKRVAKDIAHRMELEKMARAAASQTTASTAPAASGVSIVSQHQVPAVIAARPPLLDAAPSALAAPIQKLSPGAAGLRAPPAVQASAPAAASSGQGPLQKKQRTAEIVPAPQPLVARPLSLKTREHTWIKEVVNWYIRQQYDGRKWDRFPPEFRKAVRDMHDAYDVITLFGYGRPGSSAETDIFMCHTVKTTKVCRQNGTLRMPPPLVKTNEAPRFLNRESCKQYISPWGSDGRLSKESAREAEKRRLAKERFKWSELQKRQLMAKSRALNYDRFESLACNYQAAQERRLLANNILHLLLYPQGGKSVFGETSNTLQDINAGKLTEPAKTPGKELCTFEKWFCFRMLQRTNNPKKPLGERLILTQHGNTEASIAHLLPSKREFNMKTAAEEAYGAAEDQDDDDPGFNRIDDGYYDEESGGYNGDEGGYHGDDSFDYQPNGEYAGTSSYAGGAGLPEEAYYACGSNLQAGPSGYGGQPSYPPQQQFPFEQPPFCNDYPRQQASNMQYPPQVLPPQQQQFQPEPQHYDYQHGNAPFPQILPPQPNKQPLLGRAPPLLPQPPQEQPQQQQYSKNTYYY